MAVSARERSASCSALRCAASPLCVRSGPADQGEEALGQLLEEAIEQRVRFHLGVSSLAFNPNKQIHSH